MKFRKEDVRKIKKATKEELSKLQEEYKAFSKNVRGMSPAGLLLIAIAGVAVILLFKNSLLDLIGLILLIYPVYIFIRRGGHRQGYFEGYYEMMTKLSSRDEHGNSNKSEDQK